MKETQKALILQQVDRKISEISSLRNIELPKEGWIYMIRTALKMSLRQLGKRMGITPQSIKEMENREVLGAITLKTMNEIAKAMDLKFVYGFVPNADSLEKMIEDRAFELAKEMTKRTEMTMKLEDQGIPEENLHSLITRRAQEIKEAMPGYLWD